MWSWKYRNVLIIISNIYFLKRLRTFICDNRKRCCWLWKMSLFNRSTIIIKDLFSWRLNPLNTFIMTWRLNITNRSLWIWTFCFTIKWIWSICWRRVILTIYMKNLLTLLNWFIFWIKILNMIFFFLLFILIILKTIFNLLLFSSTSGINYIPNI